MQKASFNPDLAKQGGGGVEAGKYRIKAAKTQNIKTDYKANQLYLVLDLIQLDANWQPVREAEEQELRLSFGSESLKHYRPAKANGPTDPDPVDQGDAPDAEGNTVGVLDSEPFNRSTSAMVFFDSLAKHGFSKEKLNECYTPMFAGMEFELASYSPKECNEKFGTRLNTKPMKDKEDPTRTVEITYKVAVKWNNPNYLSGTVASSSLVQGQTSSTGAAPTPNESPEELAAKVLKVVIDKKKGSEIKSAQAVNGFVTNAYTQHNPKLPASQLSAVQAIVKDAAKLAEILVKIDGPVEFNDEGKPMPVTYPLAIPA